MENFDSEFPEIGIEGWSGGYKLEVFTVPVILQYARHLLGALGGSTGFEAVGNWKFEGRIQYDDESTKITFFHEDYDIINFIIDTIASLAFTLKETAILCVVTESNGKWRRKTILTEEVFNKFLPNPEEFREWLEFGGPMDSIPNVSLVILAAAGAGLLESNKRDIKVRKKILKERFPDLSFEEALEQKAEAKGLQNVSSNLNVSLTQISAKHSMKWADKWEHALLWIAETLENR